jgi:hypothetical protein
MGNNGRIRLASAAALAGGVFGIGVAMAGPAGAAPGQTAHGTTTYIPVGALNPPVGPPLDFSSCPFDDNWVFGITGNSVGYGVDNKNGSWGGGTLTGAATLSMIGDDGPGPSVYSGQATGWSGGGDNLKTSSTTGVSQGEIGETFHFNGVSTDGSNTPLTVVISYHATENNKGTITNFSENVTCR